jgi:hypothetical protein
MKHMHLHIQENSPVLPLVVKMPALKNSKSTFDSFFRSSSQALSTLLSRETSLLMKSTLAESLMERNSDMISDA